MLLSFIIPSYHCEAYIDRCLRSIRMLMSQWGIPVDEYEIIKLDDLHHEDRQPSATGAWRKHAENGYGL